MPESTSRAWAPGIYPDVPEAMYFAIDAVSHSTLHLFSRTAAHAREHIIHPPEPTDAQELGTAVHMAVLEPGRFAAEYVVAPKVDRRTTKGKADWYDFEVRAKGKGVLTAEQKILVEGMKVSAWSHPRVRSLLEAQGSNEVVVVWDRDGVLCKARFDRICNDPSGHTVGFDIKTCRDASPWGFRKACENYGYYAKAAWYLDGLNRLSQRQRKFILLAIESDQPHCCALYQFDQPAIELGHIENAQHLMALEEARKTGQWPGYGQDITTIRLSDWKFRAAEAME